MDIYLLAEILVTDLFKFYYSLVEKLIFYFKNLFGIITVKLKNKVISC